METKEQLINKIKEWISIESDIAALRKKIKDKNNKKKQLTSDLLVVMKENTIDCFDINGGALVYKKNKSKKCITGKSLLQILKQRLKGHEAEDLTKYILNNREEMITETIKHKKDK